jgi:hypothetical protein
MKTTPFFAPGAAAILLAACQTGPVTDSTVNEGPVFGKRDETTFVAGTDTGEVNLGDLAKIAKTIRKYKRLNASEQEIIRRIAALKLDGFVAGEMQRLAPQFEPRKAAVRQRTSSRVAEVRRQATAAKTAPAVVEQQVKAVVAESETQLAAIDTEWRQTAMAAVARKYGTDFAVPVRTADNKPVVALASLRGSGVQVASDAYELSISPAQLAAAAAAGGRITHDGRDVAVLDTTATLQ